MQNNVEVAVPFGRPRCDMRTTDFAPFSSTCRIVGRAPAIRALFEILPSLKGTLKSTLHTAMDGDAAQAG